MDRKLKMLIAGAGAVAGLYAASRVFGRKRYNSLPYGYGIKLKKAVTVNCPPEQLYAYWRNLRNLPKLFNHVLSVDVLDRDHSHWTLRAPGGRSLEWDAEITVDRRGEMIGWRSLEGAGIDNAGYVRFEPASGNRGTVVRLALQYNPPAGKLGAAVLTVLGERPSSQLEEALRKFKQLMEAGEIPVADEKDAEREPDRVKPQQLSHSMEPVEAASEDSFPASDAPAWTGTTGPTG